MAASVVGLTIAQSGNMQEAALMTVATKIAVNFASHAGHLTIDRLMDPREPSDLKRRYWAADTYLIQP